MTRAALLVLALASLAGCQKKSSPPPPAPGGDAGQAADAALTDDPDDLDESDVRAGKRTGLEAPDATPQVATEPLVRALVRGNTAWAKVVDTSVGLVELTSIPAEDDRSAVAHVEHRCGAQLEQTLMAFSMGATESLDAPGLVYDVLCDNIGLAVTVPGVTSHAVCSISSPSDDGLEYDLVFVPDPRLGLRLIGVSTADAVTTDDALRDQFDEALGRFGARCP
ncbi:MAG TPA: hypothetical protein VM261_04975 [Kofleriaceae bacterium]|nr:hypothetical protein [Kofleriaceae bacterium]